MILSHNIYELFLSKFADSLNRPFLTIPGGLTYTFGQLDRRSAAMATVLAHNGVRPGDRVVAQIDKSPDAIALYLACLRGGFTYVPLPKNRSVEDIGFYLGDVEPSVLICKEEDVTKFKPVADIVGVPTVHTLSSRSTGTLADAANEVTPVNAIVRRDASDMACILYTSGSAGRSKGVMITHGNLISNAQVLHAIWRWRQGDVLLHQLPISNNFGLFTALHTAIMNASEVIFLPEYSREAVVKNLQRVTVAMALPKQYEELLSDPEFGSVDCRTVRLFISSSAPLLHSTFSRFLERTGHAICEGYSITECGIIASNPPEGERLAGSVGYALPNVAMRIADADDNPLSSNEVGEVQVKGANLFAGYWQMPDHFAEETTADGFFKTGDAGFFGTDGRLTLAGRLASLVVSGGMDIYPKEIEIILDSIPGVLASAVIGLPHPTLDEAVAALIVGDHRVTPAMLAEAIAQRVSPHKVPLEFLFVDDLPRSSTGRVKKSNLRAKYAELFTAEAIG